MALSPEYICTSLQALYGSEFTAADVRAWCMMNDSNYQTVTNKLKDYKVGRGKWNLEVVLYLIFLQIQQKLRNIK